jgi:hypothetical protein
MTQKNKVPCTIKVACRKNGSIYIGDIPEDTFPSYSIIIDAEVMLGMIQYAKEMDGSIALGHHCHATKGQIVIGHYGTRDSTIENVEYIHAIQESE